MMSDLTKTELIELALSQAKEMMRQRTEIRALLDGVAVTQDQSMARESLLEEYEKFVEGVRNRLNYDGHMMNMIDQIPVQEGNRGK